MPRFRYKHYQQRLMLAMTVYVAFMLLVWPLVRTTTSVPLKLLLALAPVVPMLYVIGLMVRRIRDSDELEQRTHLIALGVATAVVGTLSLVGGFLASAQVLQMDGSILIWVFPLLMFCYGTTRWWVAQRYGISLSCSDENGVPMYLRFLLVAIVMAAIAAVCWRSLDDGGRGVLCGMSSSFVLIAAALAAARRHARRHQGVEGNGA
ncbi:hypothetical protein ACPPVV_17410 [Rhodanobacter sp. Col0626]|uniref:hypothetical protein n=1 Tax=Rhodanobacter sp. Col0626 TaxID=3415679 RepID=UPI003CEF00F7